MKNRVPNPISSLKNNKIIKKWHAVIINHRLKLNHKMQWDEILIMDSEVSYKKELISEMIHIKRQQLSSNKQSETDMLSNTYQPIIDHLFLS